MIVDSKDIVSGPRDGLLLLPRITIRKVSISTAVGDTMYNQNSYCKYATVRYRLYNSRRSLETQTLPDGGIYR